MDCRFEKKEQRICGRIERSEIRIARILSLKEPQVCKRGYSSVEQIQDTEIFIIFGAKNCTLPTDFLHKNRTIENSLQNNYFQRIHYVL
jgi:hypothetical protein